MIAYNLLMIISAFLCTVSALCVAHHILWLFKESKPTIKQMFFAWGVVAALILLATFFIYNFIKA